MGSDKAEADKMKERYQWGIFFKRKKRKRKAINNTSKRAVKVCVATPQGHDLDGARACVIILYLLFLFSFKKYGLFIVSYRVGVRKD